MNFDGKWSDMSQQEQRDAKEQFGSRSNWQDAKEKAQANSAATAAQIESDRKAYEADPAGVQAQAEAAGYGSNIQFPEPVASSSNSNQQSAKKAVEDYTVQNQATVDRRNIKKEVAKENNIDRSEAGKGQIKAAMNDQQKDYFDTAGEVIYGVDDISKYDFADGGIGSLKDKNIASRADVTGLMEYGGFSAQEIQDHINATGATVKPKAQKLLDSYINDMKDPGTTPGIDDEDIGITDGDVPGGGNDTVPGGNNDTVPGGGNNTVPGGGNNTVPGGGNNTVPGGSNIDVGTTPGNKSINIQDAVVDQRNNQTFDVNMKTNLTSTVIGDNNVTDIGMDNSVRNYGGDQNNESTVTQGTNQQAQGFLDEKINNLTGTGVSTTPQSNTSTGDGYRRGQDLTDPNYFINRQTADVGQGNDQDFNVDVDNTIDSRIEGDNNFTQIYADNSVRNYGGDQRNFNYISNNTNPYTETPASMATLSGYYSVSDSPASNAAFVDQYQTMNRDASKKYDNVGLANEMIYRGNTVSSINKNDLDAQIYKDAELSRARAEDRFRTVFGDYQNFPTFDFQMPPPPEPIEDLDAEELYKQFS